MKVTVKEENENKLDYPKLMISDVGQIIIALSDHEQASYLMTGVMIELNGHSFCGGAYQRSIIKSAFRDFHGTITIEQ